MAKKKVTSKKKTIKNNKVSNNIDLDKYLDKLSRKPIVKATGNWGIMDLLDRKGKSSVAMFFGKIHNHPKLGTVDNIQTSKVLRVDFEHGHCETLNTVYRFEV